MNVTKIRRPADMERITTPKLAKAFIEEQVALIKEQVGDKKVLLALSGGVDSSVVAALLIKAIGQQLVCVHVNHGLLRKGEPEQVIEVFRNQMNANLVYVDATDRFLDKLAGVDDPEKKRKIIGGEFIEVFAEEARKLDGIEFLAQGTIWPDILESEEGIKAHHNAGGLPEDMDFELVEPVRILFKDEVRVVGDELGLPHDMVYRQPFPGPGLGVRCPGAITRDRLEAVRESDAILREEFDKNGLAGKIWQYFTVVPEFRSTGIKNGKRAFEWCCIVRAVCSTDVMTATAAEIPHEVMVHITDRITHEVAGINRVLYDFTPKPTGTVEIEWDQKGTHEPHLSVLDYKKKVREQEVEELTEHKNLLEHDLHDISECVDEIQKEKEQAEKERDAVIKKTEVLEKRFSALNSKAGLVDSHAREYGYYPEEWLPEAGTLESAKSYRKRIFPLVKKVANMIQALYSKYLELKSKNQKLSDRNLDLENRVDRLREEVSVIKKENVALLNVTYDMDRVVAVLGENKVKEAIEVAKHLEQANAKQKGKKRRIDREGR